MIRLKNLPHSMRKLNLRQVTSPQISHMKVGGAIGACIAHSTLRSSCTIAIPRLME